MKTRGEIATAINELYNVGYSGHVKNMTLFSLYMNNKGYLDELASRAETLGFTDLVELAKKYREELAYRIRILLA